MLSLDPRVHIFLDMHLQGLPDLEFLKTIGNPDSLPVREEADLDAAGEELLG